jgi:hypothetical protein
VSEEGSMMEMLNRVRNANEMLVQMSDWLNDEISHVMNLDLSRPNDRALLRRIRLDKIAEEVGEAQDALIGVEGSNPRKGLYGTDEDVHKELLDNAITALLALRHDTGSEDMIERLLRHIGASYNRLGLGG